MNSKSVNKALRPIKNWNFTNMVFMVKAQSWPVLIALRFWRRLQIIRLTLYHKDPEKQGDLETVSFR